MTESLHRFLVPTDGSEAAHASMQLAIALAKRAGGEVIVAHVVDRVALATETASMDGGYDPASIIGEPAEAVKAILDEAETQARAAGVAVRTVSLEGMVVQTIVDYAAHEKVDAIIMAHERGSVEAFILGSTTDGVLTRSPVPVFVVRAAEEQAALPFSRILVGVDGTETGQAAFAHGLRYAQPDGVLVLCNVIETSTLVSGAEYTGFDPSITIADLRAVAEKTMAVMAATATAAGVRTESVVIEGSTVDELVLVAEQQRATLVVVGTHGRHGLGRFLLGSVAGGVARHSPVAVAVVHAA